MDADDCLSIIETKLDLTDCNNEECVAIAMHQLEGPAKSWWDSYCDSHADPSHISLWHPRCLHSRIVLVLCIMCLFCLKKDLIVKIKGYLCKYDLLQGPFYSLIWIGRANIAFVEGLCVKFSVIITWQKILLFSLKLNWICNGKDKSPLNSKSFLCFQNNSLTFGQISFCTTPKL